MEVFAPLCYYPSVTSHCLRGADCFLCFCADGATDVAARLSERWREGAGRDLACALLGAAAVAQREGSRLGEERSVSSRAALRELIASALLMFVSSERTRGRSSPARLPEVLLAGETKYL